MFFYTFFGALLIGAIFCAWRISVADFRRRIIPDAYLFPLMLIGLVVTHFFPWICSTAESVAGAVLGYAMAAIVGIIFEHFSHDKTNTPIGMGDIKLLAVAGLWLGTFGLAIGLVFACIFGMIWGYKKHQKFIPFAPFLFAGGFLSFITILFLL
ncbi:MAG: prepilin peptidase [Alphaproteobacteria bacterium]|nr:prepilin peptidase [Alphaproteobacteria bacterium]